MRYRKFGDAGWKVSEVGLGTWQFGGDWGAVSEEGARAVMKAAVDCGVTFFDTADVYGAGRSETLIGGFFDECSEKVYIATKMGRLEGYPDGYSLDLFRRCVENSLKRLKREAIDLLQLHCIPQRYLESGEAFDWLRVLRDEGKIRAFGASVETEGEAEICLEQSDLASLQVIFNIFRQKPADGLFKRAKRNGIALILRLPLASGLLAGKFSRETAFASSDHRTYNRNGEAFSAGETFSGLEFAFGLECVEEIRRHVPAGMDMAQFALRWILDHPEVSVVIPGATKVAQVQGNAAASDLPPLAKPVHTALRKLYDEKIDQRIRGRM
ncbi:MAG: aldo/keto reductase [Chitinispirillaceae bacterium]|nr:aldo/keto reductase [Chitinispirillaceae bacterium]